MSRLSLITIFFLSNHCFICNGSWAQASDNNHTFRRQSGFRIGSTSDPRSSNGKYVRLPKSRIEESTSSIPSTAPILAPPAAPTAAPSAFFDTQSDKDDHNAWLLQQQQYALEQEYQVQSSQYLSSSSAFKTTGKSKGLLPSFLSTKGFAAASQSFLDAAKAYSQKVHNQSPTTFWTTVTSIVIFLSWNLLPLMRPILMQFFLASRRSAKNTLGLSLVLSAVSHNSFRHVLFNLLVFLNLSPAMNNIRVPSTSWLAKNRSKYLSLSQAALWPLLVGGALAGNLLFLLFRPGGSCLGLSGVTCAMMGAYACAAPERLMKVRIYGVHPVSVRMKTLVQILLGVSLFGALFMLSSPICHLGHLGGLLFGILYYQKLPNTMSLRVAPSYAPTAVQTTAPTAAPAEVSLTGTTNDVKQQNSLLLQSRRIATDQPYPIQSTK